MKHQYKLLQDIGFDFVPRKVIVSWKSGFKELASLHSTLFEITSVLLSHIHSCIAFRWNLAS